MSLLSKAYFHDEAAAFEHLEKTLWGNEPVCPHCGSINKATKLRGSATRLGVWKCNAKECRKQFTVKVGTVFEHGRIPLHKTLQAVHLMTSSKKGISAHQLHRMLEVTYKTAWFLAHRIREAMRDGSLAPMGGAGDVVEADETYHGCYLAEFDFRYNNRTALGVNDPARAEQAMKGISGKRLTYRHP